MTRVRTQVTLLWLCACLLLSFLALAYPMYVIRPFRHQGSHELALALQVLQIRPVLQICAAVAALFLAALVVLGPARTLSKIFASVLGVLVVAFAALSFINIFERMFHPLDHPTFAPVRQVKLDSAEQVLAIKVKNAARAYPIRVISYHHIVNDVLAGLPVVATY